MDKLYLLAKGYTNRFPGGNEPYQITTRLLEECGEVASAVNHFERSGIKTLKHGEPFKQHSKRIGSRRCHYPEQR